MIVTVKLDKIVKNGRNRDELQGLCTGQRSNDFCVLVPVSWPDKTSRALHGETDESTPERDYTQVAHADLFTSSSSLFEVLKARIRPE